LDGHSYGAVLDVVAIHGDEMVDRDVEFHGGGVDGKDADRAKRGEQTPVSNTHPGNLSRGVLSCSKRTAMVFG
jgi:hypothetical protein